MSCRPKLGSNNAAGEQTRARLLAVAGACFAERGYAGTSVRDITTCAVCNIGAVNYHFGGKDQLYVAVFEERFGELREHRVKALRRLLDEPALNLERVVSTFARVFLEPIVAGKRGRETMLLFMRDMVDTHLPAGMVVDRMVGPTLGVLSDALCNAYSGLAPEVARRCGLSIVSQLVHALQIQRLSVGDDVTALPKFDLDQTVTHIVQFSVAGIRSYPVETGS